MSFAFILLILNVIVAAQCISTAEQIKGGEISKAEGILEIVCMYISGVLPIFYWVQFFGKPTNSIGAPIPHVDDFSLLWYIGIGGAAACFVFGVRLFKQRKNKNIGFFAIGANTVGAMIGIYMLSTAVNAMFSTPTSDDFGALNFIFRAIQHEMQC